MVNDAARPAPQPARALLSGLPELLERIAPLIADDCGIEPQEAHDLAAQLRANAVAVRAWADRIAELEAACDTTRDQIEREAIDLQREFGPDDEDVQRLFAWSERLQAALNR
jgi:hypothetical protein